MSETTGISEQEYAERRARLGEKLREQGIDALFVAAVVRPRVPDGARARPPELREVHYAHGWVTGALDRPRPGAALRPAADVRHLPSLGPRHGEVVTVNETDDGRRSSARRSASLGKPEDASASARAPGARPCSSSARQPPGAELVNGSPLVNELRRVKSDRELELMTHACSIARRSDGGHRGQGPARGDDGRPRTRRSSTSSARRGSRRPSFPTHLFSYGAAPARLAGSDRARADRRGRARDVRLRRGLAGLLLGLRAHRRRRRAASGVRALLRDHARGPGGGPRRGGSRARWPRRSTPPAAGRSRRPGSARRSAIAWATESAWTCTSGPSSRRRTRRRSRPA